MPFLLPLKLEKVEKIILYAGENAVIWLFMYIASGLHWHVILGSSLMISLNSSKNCNIF